MKKRGQAAVESLIAIGIIFVVFIGIYLIYSAKSSEVLRSQQALDQHEDCIKLTNAITNVFVLENSEVIITTSHDLTVEPTSQRIESAKSFCTLSINAIKPAYSESSDPFVLNAGKILVKNIDSIVRLENV